ncbi:MAG: hypothetical protein RL688_1366 [Actinomycetota bacterium]
MVKERQFIDATFNCHPHRIINRARAPIHCTVDYAVWVAIECGVKKLALFHHDPTRSDTAVDELLAAARRRGEKHGVEVFAAAENQVVSLSTSSTKD